MSQKGFTSPILLVPLLILGVMFGAFWFLTNDVNVSTSTQNVKGLSTKESHAKPGIGVSIISEGGTWDLLEYLCETESACLASLEAGVRWGSVSGGKTSLHEVEIVASKEWENYGYLKYFVRRGWGSQGNAFKVTDLGEFPGAKVHTINSNGITYDVVIAPIDNVTTSFYKSAVFSD